MKSKSNVKNIYWFLWVAFILISLIALSLSLNLYYNLNNEENNIKTIKNRTKIKEDEIKVLEEKIKKKSHKNKELKVNVDNKISENNRLISKIKTLEKNIEQQIVNENFESITEEEGKFYDNLDHKNKENTDQSHLKIKFSQPRKRLLNFFRKINKSKKLFKERNNFKHFDKTNNHADNLKNKDKPKSLNVTSVDTKIPKAINTNIKKLNKNKKEGNLANSKIENNSDINLQKAKDLKENFDEVYILYLSEKMKLLGIIEKKVEEFDGMLKEQSDILLKTIEFENKYIFPPENKETESLDIEDVFDENFIGNFQTELNNLIENHKESENALKFKIINFSEKHMQKLRNIRKLQKEKNHKIEEDLTQINNKLKSQTNEIIELKKGFEEDCTTMVDALNETLSLNNKLKNKKQKLKEEIDLLSSLVDDE
ncbi:hypothetical protein EHP00_1383 [Ecytonucleospora hepatopenaei]|uniref:Uncharacterized protein n=1 Tax=Ecytonucleospora hepatopenaei TaxID=646526 RepID=A0A1W0E8W7_9MICR|nr:hypothetical protein EHP00_1383 [Ecytonucleospora hepatopenaei]